MTKDNAVSNEMKRVGHEWEEWRAAHQAKKQSIIDTYGWTSRELRVWYEEQEAHKFPLSAEESKAYRAWAESLSRQQTEMEVSDFLCENEVHDFIETLRRAGIDSFVYTSTSTAAILQHAGAAAGRLQQPDHFHDGGGHPPRRGRNIIVRTRRRKHA